ncbi:unannotated protein [freshwater metagenome]|uniref:Unannotated protein n=1 Tax=freshwater metagenome TaxID=449393 RepID=A0A6J6TFK4_9ZZZZ
MTVDADHRAGEAVGSDLVGRCQGGAHLESERAAHALADDLPDVIDGDAERRRSQTREELGASIWVGSTRGTRCRETAVDEAGGGDESGCGRSKAQRNRAAPGMADDMDSSEAEIGGKFDDVPGAAVDGVVVRCDGGRGPVAALVDRHDGPLPHSGHDRVPEPALLRETMKKDDGFVAKWSLAGIRTVDAGGAHMPVRRLDHDIHHRALANCHARHASRSGADMPPAR